MNRSARQILWLLMGLWLILTVVMLYSRPFSSGVNQLQYLSIAWQMWQSHSWLLPHIANRFDLSHPPLFYWLILGGWHLLGVVNWWPKLLVMLISLAAICQTYALSKQLWPHCEMVHWLAPAILVGAYFWIDYSTFIRFDILESYFVLLALTGIQLWYRRRPIGWLLFVIASGLGLLVEGIMLWLFIVPVVLLIPVWWQRDRPLFMWYMTSFLAILCALAIAATWWVPVYQLLGLSVAWHFLLAQFASHGLTVHLHYFLPLVGNFLPWTLWPPLWLGLALSFRYALKDKGLRFLIWVILPVLLVLIFLSTHDANRQLIPLYPVVALWLARGIAMLSVARRGQVARWMGWPFGLVLIVTGLVWIGLSYYAQLALMHPLWLARLPPTLGAVLVLIGGFWLFWRRLCELSIGSFCLSMTGVILMIIIAIGWWQPYGQYINLQPIARYVAKLHAEGEQVMNASVEVGYDQPGGAWCQRDKLCDLPIQKLLFLGRLEALVPNISGQRQIVSWVKKHPDAWILTSDQTRYFPAGGFWQPVRWWPFIVQQDFFRKRMGIIEIWRASDYLQFLQHQQHVSK